MQSEINEEEKMCSNHRKLLIASTILSFSISITAQIVGTIKSIYFPFELDAQVIRYFKNIDHAEFNNNELLIPESIEKNILMKILNYLRLKIKINTENNKNWNNTRTENGFAYKRQIVRIDENGNISTAEDPNQKPRLEYDIKNTDLIKVGPQKGYVEYPGISNDLEIDELSNNIVWFNWIVDLLNMSNKDLNSYNESFNDDLTFLCR
jgi:hypothetical protein